MPFGSQSMLDRRKNARDRREKNRQSFEDVRIRLLRGLACDAVPLSGDLIDASRTGVRLRLDEYVEEGEPILVEVHQQETVLTFSAKVLWTRETNDSLQAGCALKAPLTAKQAGELRKLAEKLN